MKPMIDVPSGYGRVYGITFERTERVLTDDEQLWIELYQRTPRGRATVTRYHFADRSFYDDALAIVRANT